MEAQSPVLTPELASKEVVYAKDQPEYKPLPVLKASCGTILSRWQLSDSERQAIAKGADILLSVWTMGQPLQPLYMEVAEHDRTLEETARWIEAL